MTSTPLPAASATSAVTARPYKLNFFGALRAEALKFRTLTTNWVMTAVLALVMIGMASVYGLLLNRMSESAEMMSQVAEGAEFANAGIESITSLAYAMGASGIDMANMLVAAVAAVFIGSEYATRSIHTSMTVVPRRSTLYLAKMTVLTVYAFILGTVLSALAYWVGYSVLDTSLQQEMEFSGGLVLNWVAAGIYFVFMAWMGYGFGALFRNNAGGIVMVVVIFFILPILASIFIGQFEWVADAYNYLPSGLGRVILTYDLKPDADISYLEGGLWFAVWALVPAVLGWLRFTFTDTKG